MEKKFRIDCYSKIKFVSSDEVADHIMVAPFGQLWV